MTAVKQLSACLGDAKWHGMRSPADPKAGSVSRGHQSYRRTQPYADWSPAVTAGKVGSDWTKV